MIFWATPFELFGRLEGFSVLASSCAALSLLKTFLPLCFRGHSLPWLSSQVSACSSSTTFTSSPSSTWALCVQLIQLFLFQNLSGPSSTLVFNFQPRGPRVHAASAGSRTRVFALPDASSSERLFVFFNTHTHTTHTHKRILAQLFYRDIYLLEC